MLASPYIAELVGTVALLLVLDAVLVEPFDGICVVHPLERLLRHFEVLHERCVLPIILVQYMYLYVSVLEYSMIEPASPSCRDCLYCTLRSMIHETVQYTFGQR